MHIEANQTFERLKESIETGYFEGLIKDFILDNSHKTILMVKPVQGLTTKKDKELLKNCRNTKLP